MTAAIFGFLVSALLAFAYTWRTLLRRPSVLLILFAALLTIHGAPMLVYLNFTGPETFIYEEALRSVDGEVVKARLLWAMAGMFVLIIVGSEFATLLAPKSWRLKQNKNEWKSQNSNQFIHIYNASTTHRLVLWLIAAAMFAVIMIENQPQNIFNYYTSGESELGKILLRRAVGGTDFYLFNVFLYSVAPFVVMVLYCLQRQRPSDGELRMLFVCFFLLVLVGKLGTLSKAPVVIFLLQFALMYLLLSKGRLGFRIWGKLFILALFLLTIIVKLTIPDIEILTVYRFLYYRVFDIPNEVLLEFFAAFPDALRHGWEYGIFGTVSRPPNEVIQPSYFAVAELTRGDVTSSSNVMFVGDAWAGYEWAGVVFTSFLVGLILRFIDLYAFRRGRSDEWACMIAGCAFGIFTLLSTAFSTSLVTGGLLLIPFASVLFVRRRGVPRVMTKIIQTPDGIS